MQMIHERADIERREASDTDQVDEWGYESFPASDAPQWWCLDKEPVDRQGS